MKALLLLALVLIFNCSFLGTKGGPEVIDKPKPAEQKSTVQAEPATVPKYTSEISQVPEKSQDLEFLINELNFEIKKLSSRVEYLQSELQRIQSKSQVWVNPLSIYSKEIALKNGTSIFGKIVYQDDEVVKIETLIGHLVIDRRDIMRIVTVMPEKPKEEYLPEEVAEETSRVGVKPALTPPPSIEVIKSEKPKIDSSEVANCVLVGNINERLDRSGNIIFSGEVKNTGNRRADFVKITLTFRKDWRGNTFDRTAFISGSSYTFDNSGITTNSSLLPRETGTFELIIPKSLGNFIGYTYLIEWETY